MTAHAYTEEQLVEMPAFDLFDALGWTTVSAIEETFGPGGTLGREMSAEVVLLHRLRSGLAKLNPQLPPEAIDAAAEELTRDRSAMDPAAANREIYALLKDGIRVSVADTEPSPQPSPSGRGSADSKRSPLPLGEGPEGEGSRRSCGGQRTERVRVIDWENPAANDFLAVRQISFTSNL